MTVETERSKAAKRVIRALRGWKTAAELDVELFRKFARVTIDRIRGPFLAQHPPKTVLLLLEKAFQHAAVRRPKAVQVTVEETRGRGIRVMSLMDDQPFIVDTIRLFFKRHDTDYWGGFNIIFQVERDADGRMVSVGEGEITESLALIEGGAGRIDDDLEAASAELTHALQLAQSTVRDFRTMTRVIERVMERCEARGERMPDQSDRYRETSAFLKWMLRENFVFMGVETEDSKYGIQTVQGPYYAESGGVWAPPHEPGTIYVRKSEVESPIHRAGRIDEVRVVLEEDGEGPDLFIRGMFTYRAVTQPSRYVPVLRNVLKAELAAANARPGSFRYKGMANVFDSLPTEFLFTTPSGAIGQMIDLVLDSEQQQEVGVQVISKDDGSAFCLVSMPKGQYSDELRRDLQASVLDGLGATYVDHGLFMGRFDTVLLHYYLTGIPDPEDLDIQLLTENIRSLATPWTSRLWQAIAREHGEERADYLVDTYGRAFPAAWMRKTTAERGMRDLRMLDGLASAEILVDVFEEGEDVILRIYQARDVFLTDLLPVIDNFGLTVISSEATKVGSRGGHLQFDSFALSVSAKHRKRLLDNRHLLIEALPAVLQHKVQNDPMNSLVLASGISWQLVDVLRGYRDYLRQLQLPISPQRIREIMLQHPRTCAKLGVYFETRFDPEFSGDRRVALPVAAETVDDLLRLIRTHDEDLVFSNLFNLMQATMRTNAYRSDRRGHYISYKFEAAKVRVLPPRNRPLFEIYVHSRDVEGVHLRFGRVARGGLRWSDRADYRTEVLGLVTTQQVKNVVIVPEGSKGGFYLLHPEKDPRKRRAQADRLYKTFIRGLLDLTDNVVDGATVHPPGVVCHDPDDPYLVVAADKGTAHLSDTANSISEAYGFWLGDAFASGGSNGYDHKGVGITARGGWVLARRHFAEMGKDPYSEPFTAVGVGDLGGDVFGNGLIETPQTKLLAAFNHLHIFLDPNPDPAVSYAERKRLFEIAGREAGWDHYDQSKLSKGGAVYDRAVKSVQLSPECREMLDIEEESVSPDVVLRAILRLEVDLLWSGGIGTYVKASTETDADADDRSNDRVRVNATELRARVLGEGANLSFTQRARVEAALHAGLRLNTDFIDNSAGVDMSDHEVNIKILLNAPMLRGELSADARNELLGSLTEEVADLVLANNDAQGRQISRDRIRSEEDIFPFGRTISFIERQLGLRRKDLYLPDEAALEERAAVGRGLTRPELAMISSHVKRWVYAELIASGRAKELTGYAEFLVEYFPVALQEGYRTDIEQHQLADEIAMTMATTRLLSDAGASFVPMAVESTGRSVFEVMEAYLRAQKLARAAHVRSTLEELRTSVTLSALYRAWTQVDAGAREVVSFWLSAGQRAPTDAEMAEMAVAVDQVYALQARTVAKSNADLVEDMENDDIPAEVAKLVLKAQYLNIALMVWSHARKLGLSFPEAVVRQLAAGRASRLQNIIDHLGQRRAHGEWEPFAVHILQTRYNNLFRELVLRMGTSLPAPSVDVLEPALVEGPLAGLRTQVDSMISWDDESPSLAALVVLEERLAGAIRRLGD